MFRFEKLEIYNLSIELVKEIYALTQTYPDHEIFSLVRQTNRSAVSVTSNIAEGSSRNSDKDKLHFINIAYSSLMETASQIDIAFHLNYITEFDKNELFQSCKHLSVKLHNFQLAIKNRNR